MTEKKENADRYNIKGADRCFQILDLSIALARPLTVTDVSRELGVNTNMAFRLLSTIENCGYMTKNEENGQYSVSLKALQLSRTALSAMELRRLVMPYLEMVWEKNQKSTLNLAVFYEGDILIVDRIDSLTLPRTYFTPGKQVPFHCTGVGKVLLSEMPGEAVDELIKKKGLKRFTKNTITDPDEFKAELARVRDEQVGRDRNEYLEGDNCSAVPVRDKDGKIIAAISLSALVENMSVEEVEASIPRLKDTAKKISFMFGSNDTGL